MYLQIALIMLIGLLAKNAILIVEFALERRRTGMSIVNAAIQGAKARLRPILMTSLALIIGLLPMMFAHGVGANGNRALGTGSIGGMLIGMVAPGPHSAGPVRGIPEDPGTHIAPEVEGHRQRRHRIGNRAILAIIHPIN